MATDSPGFIKDSQTVLSGLLRFGDCAVVTVSALAAYRLRTDSFALPGLYVSATILEESARTLVRDFPRLRVTGYVADYHEALAALADRLNRPKFLVFLGSSLGNYEAEVTASPSGC